MPSAAELRETAEKPLDPDTPQTYEIRDRQEQEQPSSSERPKDATRAPLNEDYEPDPSASIQLSQERQYIVDCILRLYSGSGTNDEDSTGAQDMRVYAKKAVYDDIASYCDTRFKIAGQCQEFSTGRHACSRHFFGIVGVASALANFIAWSFAFSLTLDRWGIPVVVTKGGSETKTVQIISSTSVADGQGSVPGEIVFKMKRAWTPTGMKKTYDVNHFVTLSLEKAAEEDGEGPSERVKYHKDQWNEKDYSHGGAEKILKTVNGDFTTITTRPPKDL